MSRRSFIAALLALPFVPSLARLFVKPAARPMRLVAMLKELYSGQLVRDVVYYDNFLLHYLSGTHQPGPDSAHPCLACVDRKQRNLKERLIEKYGQPLWRSA